MNSLSYLYYTLYYVATKLKNSFACILSIFYLYAHIYLASIEINALFVIPLMYNYVQTFYNIYFVNINQFKNKQPQTIGK